MEIKGILTNINFEVLSELYNKMGKDNIIYITQQEIAKDVGLSRATINTVFKTLKEKGYLEHKTEHIGRYCLTPEAIKVIETFRELEIK